LFYGGGISVLKAQLVGSLIITVATFAIAFIVMWVIKQLPYPWKLRVEPEGEIIGLDVFEHGTDAYPAQIVSATEVLDSTSNKFKKSTMA
jgi:Amt family ammonium transporter